LQRGGDGVGGVDGGHVASRALDGGGEDGGAGDESCGEVGPLVVFDGDSHGKSERSAGNPTWALP
jgi:hypothetical protein